MTAPTPPIAQRKPYAFTRHGITVEDPYHWLRDPGYPDVEDPEILGYIEAENAYFDAVMAPQQPLIEQLFAELKARQQPDEAAVPWKDGAYEYQWRYAQDAQYRIWTRWPVGHPDGLKRFSTSRRSPTGSTTSASAASTSARTAAILAYTTDTDGSERYTLHIKDLTTGELLPDTLTDLSGRTMWANDNATLFYVVLTENWQPYLVKSHRLGTACRADRDIYEETTGTFFVSVGQNATRNASSRSAPAIT